MAVHGVSPAVLQLQVSTGGSSRPPAPPEDTGRGHSGYQSQGSWTEEFGCKGTEELQYYTSTGYYDYSAERMSMS